ncbi:MAG: deoxyguanosinetriphosphate triphosphohydrolase [Hyphomicrobiaceae bacterium]
MTRLAEVSDHQYGDGLLPGERGLAAYAASAVPGRGRLHPEPACPTRNDLQRDRDRILHSTAFRRLTYKTQMFVYHEGDHYRTRLTHSLEVAQIARTMARQLCLDEDLAEAIALGHDLGHPPFGHAGERALDEVLADVGGFDHNVQSFRLVTMLERKYSGFDGLNLTWETLEGLVKHNGPPALGDGKEDQRLVHAVRDINREIELQLGSFASGEAQVAAIADDIAWHTHDIDDGLRAGLIAREDLKTVEIVRSVLSDIDVAGPGDRSREIYEITRRLITIVIADAVQASRQRLAQLAPGHPDDIRNSDRSTVGFSERIREQLADLRTFLFANLYRHPKVMDVMQGAEQIVQDLIDHYTREPSALPGPWRAGIEGLEHRQRMRRIADFVAGMTDRYAISEHRRLFDATPELR